MEAAVTLDSLYNRSSVTGGRNNNGGAIQRGASSSQQGGQRCSACNRWKRPDQPHTCRPEDLAAQRAYLAARRQQPQTQQSSGRGPPKRVNIAEPEEIDWEVAPAAPVEAEDEEGSIEEVNTGCVAGEEDFL